MTSALKILAIPLSLACTTLHASEQWFLMARHGECAKLDALKRKIPDLGTVADPHAFADLMRRQGHATTITEQVLAKGRSFEVLVPTRELALVFVTAEWCGKAGLR